MKTIATGSDFSGVGAFDYAIQRVCEAKKLKHKRIFACDWDKYARITYSHNHGVPGYYPKDVYEREIPKEPLDIYMTSPPCQAFSLAGNREGKEDERGILFFNSHEFIQKNKPRFFIFENVKGLLSDDNGKTFGEWIRLLGGKSVNGLPLIFPDEDSVPYHIYHKVINAKEHGIPQNRERIFIIGIRDDKDNSFSFPKEEHLEKRLKDILEDGVVDKYTLSQKYVDWILKHRDKRESLNDFPLNIEKSSGCITARYYKGGAEDPYIKVKSATESHSLRVRRLTPCECFRLMDFPNEFDFSVVSDLQAYKQAGNSIVVRVLEKILMKLSI